MNQDNINKMDRLAAYPKKTCIGIEPSFSHPRWELIRATNIRFYGENRGSYLSLVEMRKAQEEYNVNAKERNIRYIVKTTLHIVKDVMALRDIVDEDITGRINNILAHHIGKLYYKQYMIDKSFEVLTAFINKYSIDLFDGLARKKLGVVQKETYKFFEIDELNSLLCKWFGHKFIVDEYSKYNFGKERCKRCNKWKDEIKET